MPTYEFKCEKCGSEFEQHQSVNAPCPPCPDGSDDQLCMGETERLISRTSFQLKGSGWASDGYA